MRWRDAMREALYGPHGFFVQHRPADHFRTSAQSALFATALAKLVIQVDEVLGQPPILDVVDVGAGRGELLINLLDALPESVRSRVNAVAVEVAPPASPPADPAEPSPPGDAGLNWRTEIPDGVVGVLLATEWLDNIPLDLARNGRYLDADESLDEPIDAPDAAWIRRWWARPAAATEPPRPEQPGAQLAWTEVDAAEQADAHLAGAEISVPEPVAPAATDVVEIGRSRDEAWARAVGRMRVGMALAVDYGHLIDSRPALSTVTGFADGREVPVELDGSTDITCHVAMDSVAAAGSEVAGGAPYTLIRQREALRALGVDGGRPPLALASSDPAAYLRALAAASEAASLTDRHGLGAHWWLMQPVQMPPVPLR